ncbi:Gpr1 family protein [Lentinula raphanica]|uniref:Gpr1 family protein n=1 Tax=Lentinula raphanica TaxID=153919 RepID=A0AA38P707_9AGAR|nr:Gpr1 family protein [Lentinula raphanica]KAJ3766214.1 Gpr1 family protein [Lentinula raphanica]KAJ3817981.1 Gpr1 family protein [Lentinula raphanica]KAJ3837502.1 Gpr1 family protein [Lentinula raphanica]KAJ3968162.1 Gpr1 family protein [Lentinula raphanica]
MADSEKGTTLATTSGVDHHPRNYADNGSAAAYRNAPVKSNLANPGTLGLFSFASTTLILSLYNTSARGVTTPNAVVGMALFCGGLVQLLAGMWEFPRGNTFGGTAFSSYGAFWLSYATILIPGSGIADAYADVSSQEPNAIGIFLMTWMTVTFLLFIASLRKNIGFIALFFFLTLTFMCLGAGNFVVASAPNASAGLIKAGGALGIVTALIAYYVGMSELLASERAAVVGLPIGVFKHD